MPGQTFLDLTQCKLCLYVDKSTIYSVRADNRNGTEKRCPRTFETRPSTELRRYNNKNNNNNKHRINCMLVNCFFRYFLKLAEKMMTATEGVTGFHFAGDGCNPLRMHSVVVQHALDDVPKCVWHVHVHRVCSPSCQLCRPARYDNLCLKT